MLVGFFLVFKAKMKITMDCQQIAQAFYYLRQKQGIRSQDSGAEGSSKGSMNICLYLLIFVYVSAKPSS
jgi:hypothetical protein